MPSVDDVEAHLLAQDVVWVIGGSVVNLLAVWRAQRPALRLRGAAPSAHPPPRRGRHVADVVLRRQRSRLHYRGTEFVEAVTERSGQGAYVVRRAPDGTAVEERIAPRMPG